MEFFTKNPSETKKLGKILAKEIFRLKLRRALVLKLEGDLGGGKTTFLQGFAKGLGIKEKILSPTFVILKKFKVQGLNFETFYHIDCYRIRKPEEILSLGFKKIISAPKNIIAIEWAERLGKLSPSKSLKIRFKFIDKKIRRIKIYG